jgi:hypothetical protein
LRRGNRFGGLFLGLAGAGAAARLGGRLGLGDRRGLDRLDARLGRFGFFGRGLGDKLGRRLGTRLATATTTAATTTPATTTAFAFLFGGGSGGLGRFGDLLLLTLGLGGLDGLGRLALATTAAPAAAATATAATAIAAFLLAFAAGAALGGLGGDFLFLLFELALVLGEDFFLLLGLDRQRCRQTLSTDMRAPSSVPSGRISITTPKRSSISASSARLRLST